MNKPRPLHRSFLHGVIKFYTTAQVLHMCDEVAALLAILGRLFNSFGLTLNAPCETRSPNENLADLVLQKNVPEMHRAQTDSIRLVSSKLMLWGASRRPGRLF